MASNSRSRSRVQILSRLLSSPQFDEKDWQSDLFDTKAEIGDLVSLTSAPPTKWYLSWVIDVEKHESRFSTKYLLESIEDGSLCWWENIGFNVYNRQKTKENITWKWDDKQFAFNDRWRKACNRNDAYIVLPKLPSFNEGNSVTLDVRIRFGLKDFSHPRTFDNWKKLTIKEMEKYYLECVEKYNSEKKQRKSA